MSFVVETKLYFFIDEFRGRDIELYFSIGEFLGNHRTVTLSIGRLNGVSFDVLKLLQTELFDLSIALLTVLFKDPIYSKILSLYFAILLQFKTMTGFNWPPHNFGIIRWSGANHLLVLIIYTVIDLE